MSFRIRACNLFLALGFVLTVSAGLFAQVHQAFVARYDGPASGDDEARAIKVDAHGNIYVTGRSQGVGTGMDIATIKYNRHGRQQWVQRYDGPAHGEDGARAMALDSQGNIYVTGESMGVDTNFDYVTIKYDSRGTELWVRRYDGPDHGEDRAVAIAVNNEGCTIPNQACVYVTGFSDDDETEFDYVTIAYDRDGTQLWDARYDANREDDWATAIEVDSDGNAYVTGYSEGLGTFYDYATIKYDRNGNQQWVQRYDGPAHFQDYPNSIAIDAGGNVYVTGVTTSLRAYYDATTIKYDPNGNMLWVQSFNASGTRLEDNVARTIMIDPQGFVYVIGSSVSDGIGEYLTLKYTPEGDEIWHRYYRGPGLPAHVATALAFDSAGNVYVTGRSAGVDTGFDYATVKYSPEGDELWVERFDGPAHRDDLANAIALDARRNVCVTGYSVGIGTGKDFATIKYSQRR